MYSRCSFFTQTGRSFGKKLFCSFAVFSGAYFRALLLLGMESFKRKCKAVFSSRGCFGCCAKPPTIIAIDASSKGRRVQKRSVKKSSKSNNFWSTSAGDMENSTKHSQGSLSSISTLNQQLDPSNAGSTSNSSEFVNRGKFKNFASLLLWNQTRQQWLGNKKTQNRKQVREPTIRLCPRELMFSLLSMFCSWNATYESLLGSNKPFARPVPLAEMVDFLVDVWEQEGLYD
ncbi:hypothetical protein POTOM_056878 [Populus tomentosa]|uniref:Gag1-like clamp domain-containing protein n=1 Tax=Populus tomentosa TaxID=118781 RepID=A0A8X7XXV7_POPTO|nr:hypothetical protein POTOM_056878 [Populus tomentosa]